MPVRGKDCLPPSKWKLPRNDGDVELLQRDAIRVIRIRNDVIFSNLAVKNITYKKRTHIIVSFVKITKKEAIIDGFFTF